MSNSDFARIKADLAQVAGNLERLRENDIDSIHTVHLNTGQAYIKNRRRELNAECEELQKLVDILHDRITVRMNLKTEILRIFDETKEIVHHLKYADHDILRAKLVNLLDDLN